MSSTSMQVHGACHCGAVSYEATVNAAQVTICHCTDCQSLTGSAYRVTVAARAGDFRLLSGAPKVCFKVAESGRRRAQAFRADCGYPMYAHAAQAQPKTYGLRAGCIRERHALRPRQRIWCSSAQEWSANLDGMDERDRE
jgi:hypothetical protein